MKKLFGILLGLIGLAVSASAQDVATKYPGGQEALDKFISETLVYPAPAMKNSVEGTVYVTFVVKPDGSLDNIKIKRMVDPDLEAEAIRIVKKMPKWEPATRDGVAITSTYSLPIRFRLK